MELPPMIARRTFADECYDRFRKGTAHAQRESIDNPARGIFGQEVADKLTGAQATLAFPEPSAIERDTRGKVSTEDDRETAPMFSP